MFKLLIFGDSIALGRGVPKNQSWVSLISKFYDKQDTANTMVFNLGIPGESTKELLKRFKIESLARSRPSSPNDQIIIIIAIGINDSKGIGSATNYYTSPEIFRENIKKIINLSKKYLSNLVFVGPVPVDESKTAKIESVYFLNNNIKKYNDIIKKICLESNFTFINLFQDWLSKKYKNFLLDDGIHPNISGHQKIFNLVLSSLLNKMCR